jgi:hypothetical protein
MIQLTVDVISQSLLRQAVSVITASARQGCTSMFLWTSPNVLSAEYTLRLQPIS